MILPVFRRSLLVLCLALGLSACTTPMLQTERSLKPVQPAQRMAELQDQMAALQREMEALRTQTPPAVTAQTAPTGSNPAMSDNAGTYLNDQDKQAYINAYDVYRTQGATAAIAPMRDFIRDFPDSLYAPNAHYWLGEFYLGASTPDFVSAREAFAVVANRYPNTAKAAPATYRYASLLALEGNYSEARRLMTRVQQSYRSAQESGYATEWLTQHPASRYPDVKAGRTTASPATTKASTKSVVKPAAATKPASTRTSERKDDKRKNSDSGSEKTSEKTDGKNRAAAKSSASTSDKPAATNRRKAADRKTADQKAAEQKSTDSKSAGKQVASKSSQRDSAEKRDSTEKRNTTQKRDTDKRGSSEQQDKSRKSADQKSSRTETDSRKTDEKRKAASTSRKDKDDKPAAKSSATKTSASGTSSRDTPKRESSQAQRESARTTSTRSAGSASRPASDNAAITNERVR